MSVQAGALSVLDAERTNVDRLGQAVAEAFIQHPDRKIITSLPGLGDEFGARPPAEIGDDRAWFADARVLKAYAGSAPATRASGRSVSITRRLIKNNRLAATGLRMRFARPPMPEPRSHYQQRRDHGGRHAAALRNLFNRMLGQLPHCLQTRQHYDPVKPSPHTSRQQREAASRSQPTAHASGLEPGERGICGTGGLQPVAAGAACPGTPRWRADPPRAIHTDHMRILDVLVCAIMRR
ncbi:hypothetical protein GCM10009735_21190 [Actinomadura chokoriensis]